MTWFDALLGKIYNAGSEIELGAGLNFTGALQAAANAVTGFVDVTLADTISFAKATLGSLVMTPSAPIAISSGAISAPGGYVIVDTEGAAAADNLDTISTSYGGVPHVDGTVLVISQANSSRDVTIRHGVGNIKTWKGTSIALGSTGGIAVLVYRASGWQCVGSYTDAQAASLAVQALSASGAVSAGSLSVNGLASVQAVSASGAVTVGSLILGTHTTATISNGAVTVSSSHMQLDTEGYSATDDLVTLTGGTAGQLLVLRTTSVSRVVVIKHTADIRTHTAADVTLVSSASRALLVCRSPSLWSLLAAVS